MNFCLKGLSQSNILPAFAQFQHFGIGFDFRPLSFNFTQQYKVEKTVGSLPSNISEVLLLFQDEKDFMIKSHMESISKNLTGDFTKLIAEFSGETPLEVLETYNIPYHWHYNQAQRIIDLDKFKHLKRIIFKHSFLEDLNANNELFGFLQLFKSLEDKIDFEIQLDWDDDFIESILSYLNFSTISFEVNSKVEVSYQQINTELICKQLSHMERLVENS